MARIPRSLIVYPGLAVHKIWRGHNKEKNIESVTDKIKYLEVMNENLSSETKPTGGVLNALTLMSNHTHEVFRLDAQKAFSDFMRRHHGKYGAFFNKRHDRCGKVAQDRPKTTLLENDYHEMRAVFYVHANPVVAKMVKKAEHYEWSTHQLYAFGKRRDWMKNVVFPDWYIRLGKTMLERQRRYRRLFDLYLRQNGLLRQAFLSKPFFGSPAWVQSKKLPIKAWRESRPPP